MTAGYLTVTCSRCNGRGWTLWFRHCTECQGRGKFYVRVNPPASFEITPWGVLEAE